jgi:hypothetical protein
VATCHEIHRQRTTVLPPYYARYDRHEDNKRPILADRWEAGVDRECPDLHTVVKRKRIRNDDDALNPPLDERFKRSCKAIEIVHSRDVKFEAKRLSGRFKDA